MAESPSSSLLASPKLYKPSSLVSTHSASSARSDQKTIFDIIYSPIKNSTDFYGASLEQQPSQVTQQKPTIQSGGCVHLTKLKQEYIDQKNGGGGGTMNNIFDNYRILIQYSMLWHQSKKSKAASSVDGDNRSHSSNGNNTIHSKTRKHNELPIPECSTCLYPLSHLHACLHCVYFGCWKKGHIKQHQKEKKHTFAMDFNRYTLFCSECDDYIYDVELEETIINFERYTKLGRKRQRVQPWEPTRKDINSITHYSTLSSCQGIRGLCNMGNTCFMNVILQSLIHNPLLKAYFLSDRHNSKTCQKQHCMCCEMNDLFAEFYANDKKPYGPCRFLQSMWMSMKELAGYAQQDAHEFFISALNNIHAGCEEHKLGTNCECIIHKTFAGLLQSNVTCLKCKNVTTTYDPMLDISLGMLKTPKSLATEKRKNHHHSHSDSKKGNASIGSSKYNEFERRKSRDEQHHKHGNTLLDCLDRYTQPEKLGLNEYSCSKCGNTFQEATKQLSFKRLPPVLSIQLKRFEHGLTSSKIETKIRFPVELNLTPYTTSKDKEEDNIYTLFAVVNHQGKMDTGHYTMYAKHRNEWFRFDDHNVTTAYQKEVLDSKAYMCFYIKKSLEYEHVDPFKFE
ncbi:hypothetical protein BDF20DRAFT_1004934 [Mycotypha africana]|uniref:uncharacterized protein n=1 Tax=Mycotypha africana TaxID=64632 RepID=UPI002301E879|nr:uncharacterized protein BDF20DRAFT_1004934 [Mycotypha africana]KAI8967242.1 hypothetical protein BDF20DRAFT_1004934 [Mycotypha africana]